MKLKYAEMAIFMARSSVVRALVILPRVNDSRRHARSLEVSRGQSAPCFPSLVSALVFAKSVLRFHQDNLSVVVAGCSFAQALQFVKFSFQH